MKRKKERSMGQAKERKEINKIFLAKALREKNAHTCIDNYEGAETSNCHSSTIKDTRDELSYSDDLGSIDHIYTDEP